MAADALGVFSQQKYLWKPFLYTSLWFNNNPAEQPLKLCWLIIKNLNHRTLINTQEPLNWLGSLTPD